MESRGKKVREMDLEAGKGGVYMQRNKQIENNTTRVGNGKGEHYKNKLRYLNEEQQTGSAERKREMINVGRQASH